jgi:uncharacterized lipoprotein YddW (UPF0748 family)
MLILAPFNVQRTITGLSFVSFPGKLAFTALRFIPLTLPLVASSLLLNGLVSAPLAQAISAQISTAQTSTAQTSTAQAEPNHLNHLARAQEQPPVLGVIKSADSSDSDWQTMVERLDATGLEYQVIEWSEVQRKSDLGAVTVLFLPSAEQITSGQMLGLQAWLNRGGRLIVSGAVGSQSSAGVQNILRSLLGAYWASELPQAQPLLPLQIASHRWVRNAAAGDVTGGVLVPTSLASQPVAVWEQAETTRSGASNSAAVVVTQRTTFLGWRWGDEAASTAEFDSSWLRSAATRFEGRSPLAGAPIAPAARTEEAAPEASTRAPQARIQNNPQTDTQSNIQNPTQTHSNPPSSASQANRPQNRPQTDITQRLTRPSPAQSTTRQPSAEQPSAQVSQDPAEQMTPADLDVARSSFRITLYEATSMRQELENLIGRYESALILANVRTRTSSRSQNLSRPDQIPAQTKIETPEMLAVRAGSTSRQNSGQNSGQGAIDNAVLTAARQGYSDFSASMNQRDYATARQQWLATRQLLWDNFPLDQPLSQPEVRAIWLDRGTIVQAGSRRGLEQIFDRLADSGINTVFFETVNAGYPIYPSQIAPAQNPLTQHWDPLAEAVDLAHQRGMELHAWVWTFAAGNQAHNVILNQPASFPGPLLAAYPDWANYDNQGQMIPPGQQKPFLDPANPEVRSYLLSLFEEIVTRYNVDGLQLDYIRYPFQDPRTGGHTYGYGAAARQQFSQLTGVDPATLSPSDPAQRQLWQQWTDFRIEQVNSFVADTSDLVHRLNPSLILSTAVFALPENRRLSMIQQNWEAWAQQGDVDMIVLMSYAGDTNSLQRLTNPWLANNDQLGAALILPGIRMLNLSDATVIDQIQSLRDSSSGGFALFAAENLNGHLQDIFHQIQGNGSAEPIPYRDPFAAAASRYDILMQQWQWLLDHDQLQMREQQQETWQTKTTALEQALKNLAADPSAANLHQAKMLLASFQNQFKTWMDLPTLSEDYRVRTWQNHLAIIEKLLNYGGQVTLARQGGGQQAATRPAR